MDFNTNLLPVFLGMSHRAARRGYAWDFLGVTKLLIFPFFPQRLTGLQFLVAIDPELFRDQPTWSYKLVFTDQSQPGNQAWTDQQMSVESRHAGETVQMDRSIQLVPSPVEPQESSFGWEYFNSSANSGVEIVAGPAPPLFVWRPCVVLVEIEVDGRRYARGEFVCALAQPPPLSDEERRAIASRPAASKALRFHIECTACGSELDCFAQLDSADPRPAKLAQHAIPLHEAPQTWSCQCGAHVVDLSSLKLGLHDLFRRSRPIANDPAMQFTPLYEAGRIQGIVAEYERLIEIATDEEILQKFLEEHPLFWGFLSPLKILHKPAVLTKKRADFGVLSTHKVLYLVEIEKPTTRLTNQDGNISAEIQRGANQIRDWQLVVGNHRLALLSELGLKESDVHEVRYVLIGGLARRTTGEGLTKLRRLPLAPNTDFHCFDELGFFLNGLAGELDRL